MTALTQLLQNRLTLDQHATIKEHAAALKSLHAQVESQQAEIAQLKKENTKLRERLYAGDGLDRCTLGMFHHTSVVHILIYLASQTRLLLRVPLRLVLPVYLTK